MIKTRMQSLEARTQYRNSFHCAARILSEEGVLRFWRGATPRLARLVLSGGIVFTVYEKGESLGALLFPPRVLSQRPGIMGLQGCIRPMTNFALPPQ